MTAGYDGPVVDAFLHTPGSAATSRPTRAATRVDWHGDPRLARVIHTFALARRECCLVACL